ncbi:hypothetical protein SporoP8_10915 [Sporosarcina ureae]|uniref:helix-turn-helix domain-containing protein n=1 Tax=Sporosarcina ureae TaxID=1571 RepID=UPI000A147EE5|nr:helix-turn-helix domain-containing protein [Sporosarcina ureae]ARJ39338.1 hypothetical protein SporoP8_10915 [Sporosarcina ureae]
MHNQLGEEILRLRKFKKMTQTKLSEGICSQPTISMIEKGTIIPGVDILTSIAQKLNVPVTNLTNLVLTDNLDRKHEIITDLEGFTIEQRFDEVYAITSLELKNDIDDKWFEAFLKWQHLLSCYYLKKLSIEDTIRKVKVLLTTVPDSLLNKDFLFSKINNTIAFLYATKKDYSAALFYYNKIDLDLINGSPRLDRNNYLLRVLYNKTKTLYDMGELDLAVNHAEQGIAKSIEHESMSVIGNFYYYMGQCYEKMGKEFSEISFAYEKARFFFQLLGRDFYIGIVERDKSFFLHKK